MSDVFEDTTIDPVVDETECPKCRSGMCDGTCDGSSPTDARVRGFEWARDLMVTVPPEPIIEGLVHLGAITVLVAEPAVGKTFFTLRASASVSDGVTFFGRRVKGGSVAYISFEGDALGKRLQALEAVGHRFDNLAIRRAESPLSPVRTREGAETPSLGELDLNEILDDINREIQESSRPAIVLLVVDTIRASLNGSEDSSEDVSAYLRAVRRILRRLPEAGAILIHHAGWQDGDTKRKRERGSSAFRGNADATFYLEAGEKDDTGNVRLTLRTLKVRDIEPPPLLPLIRRQVLLDIDAHGREITSCVIERDTRTREDLEAERAEAVAVAQRKTDLDVLRAMRDYPDATNQRRLRAYIGINLDALTQSVGRLLRAGYAKEGKRGEPYQVTGAGHNALNVTVTGPLRGNRVTFLGVSPGDAPVTLGDVGDVSDGDTPDGSHQVGEVPK